MVSAYRACVLALLLAACATATLAPVSPWRVEPTAQHAEWFEEAKDCWNRFFPDRQTSRRLKDIEFWIVPDSVRNAWAPVVNDSTCMLGSIACARGVDGHPRVILWHRENDEDTFKHEALHTFGAEHSDSIYDGYFVRSECK